jgi:hypothetical protein
MAFVFESDRKINELNKLANPIGPGQYFAAENPGQLHRTHSNHFFSPWFDQSITCKNARFRKASNQLSCPISL